MRKIAVCGFLVIAMAFAATAADVTGKWSGTFTPESGENGSAFVILKQTGTAITGTGGPDENQQWPDLKGTIHGDKVTLEVKSTSDGTLYKCDLVLAGDHLKGAVLATSGGQTLKAAMDVQRVK